MAQQDKTPDQAMKDLVEAVHRLIEHASTLPMQSGHSIKLTLQKDSQRRKPSNSVKTCPSFSVSQEYFCHERAAQIKPS